MLLQRQAPRDTEWPHQISQQARIFQFIESMYRRQNTFCDLSDFWIRTRNDNVEIGYS